ncbi:hypothetical protein AVEN_235507-1 [Araneus ventricosus]|uniref:Uncharacterized protein n=1 Tax=Araneus ventricosus TaxID=182803 RepID=A0A4Y2A5A3_ARAVE|nr:hypothetical protein AVEN_235507-1 [Araneus ventricosus]
MQLPSGNIPCDCSFLYHRKHSRCVPIALEVGVNTEPATYPNDMKTEEVISEDLNSRMQSMQVVTLIARNGVQYCSDILTILYGIHNIEGYHGDIVHTS